MRDAEREREWVQELARLLASRRCNGSVYMDGSHNPVTTEVTAAHWFITALFDEVYDD